MIVTLPIRSAELRQRQHQPVAGWLPGHPTTVRSLGFLWTGLA
jgi:hypothetical protein